MYRKAVNQSYLVSDIRYSAESVLQLSSNIRYPVQIAIRYIPIENQTSTTNGAAKAHLANCWRYLYTDITDYTQKRFEISVHVLLWSLSF